MTNCLHPQNEVVKNGRDNRGNQRWKCMSCNRTFGDTTFRNPKNTKNERLILLLVLTGCSTDQIAERLGLAENFVKQTKSKYLKFSRQIIPSKQQLSVNTLHDIFTAIQKSKISYVHTTKKRRHK